MCHRGYGAGDLEYFEREEEEVRTIEDPRGIIYRNHDAREYSYKCRRRNEQKWNGICRKALTLSLLFFIMACLVGWSL